MQILGGEDGLECENHVEGTQLEQVSEFKYLGYALDESGADFDECYRKAESRRKIAGRQVPD